MEVENVYATCPTWTRTAIAALLVASLIAPSIPAQPRNGAEIVDPTGDAAVMNVREDSADIRRVWINESAADGSEELIATTQVTNLSDDRSVIQDLTWAVSFAEGETNWTLRASYDDAQLVADVLRDGNVVDDTEASAETVNDTVVVTWSDHATYLAAGQTLNRVHAWSTSERLDGDTECHDRSVADCAPNEGFGQAVVLAGEPPTARGGGIVLAADRAEKAASNGERVRYDLEVRNDADGERSVVLNTTAPESYAPRLGQDGVSVAPGQSQSVDLTMTAPRDAAEGTVAFTVLAAVDGELVQLDLTLQVGDGGDGPVRVDTGRGVGQVEAGSTATYTIEVTHEGLLEATYDLKPVGRTADWVSLNRSNVTLASNETATVEVTVQVPSKAPTASYPHVIEVQERDGDARLLAALGTRVQGADEIPGDGPLPSVPAPGITAALAALGAAAWVRRRRD